jgi:hypothetical protein
MIEGTARCCDVRGISHRPIHRNLEDSDRSCLGSTDEALLRAPSKTFGRLIQTLHLPIPSESLASWHISPTGIPSGLIRISRHHRPSERPHDRCLRVLLVDAGADPELCQQFHHLRKRRRSQLSEALPTGTSKISAEYSFHTFSHTANCYISTYIPCALSARVLLTASITSGLHIDVNSAQSA